MGDTKILAAKLREKFGLTKEDVKPSHGESYYHIVRFKEVPPEKPGGAP
jgi:hypothetical protein